MNYQLKSETEPFGESTEFEEFETLDLEAFEPWQSEINPDSPPRVRWIQESLNKILGLRLKVDGIMGQQTRSAIRTFQQKQKLLVDGVAGPATIRAMTSAGAVTPPANVIPPDTIQPADARLESFDFDKSKLKPFHLLAIDKVADKIVGSWRMGKPFVTVNVVGHTDTEGAPQYNQALGLRRALAVRADLQKSLKNKQADLYYKVLVLASSKGQSEPIDITNTPKGQARNRRVEIFLSTKALKPLPKPRTVTIEPVIITPTPPRKCDPNDQNRLRAECEKDYRACMTKCGTEINFILNKIKDIPSLASCFSFKRPAAKAACALALGGVAAKELIDEYFRLSNCKQNCKRSLAACQFNAQRCTRW